MMALGRILAICCSTFFLVSCNGDDFILTTIGTVAAILTLVSSGIVFFVQYRKQLSESFISYTKHLKSSKESDRIASAILLRTYINKAGFTDRTLNLIVSLLKDMPSGNLQKVLGDSISYIQNADGYDFQKVNMHDVLIKPKSYIQYDLTKDAKYLQSRIKLRGADFFKSNLTQMNAHSVDFTNAIFYKSHLSDARFKNCLFNNAKFYLANLSGVVFQGCVLTGADFSGARGLSTTMVRTDNKSAGLPLINFLNKDGVFCSEYQVIPVYEENKNRKKIFVSKLGVMDSLQQMHYDRIIQYISDNYDVEIDSLEREEYQRFGQLTTVESKIAESSGFISFAFSYLYAERASLHKNMKAPNRVDMSECSYTSPWIQIEIAFADSLKIPTLIIQEDGIIADGILDDMIVKNDHMLQKFTYKGGLTDEDKDIIADWYHQVDCRN